MPPTLEPEKYGLVIERQASPRERFGAFLVDEGWVPRLAGSIDEAFELAFWHAPDLVILNVDMAPPQELYQRLDELRLVSLLPFALVITGKAQRLDIAGTLGQAIYLPQPVQRGDFRRLALHAADARERGVSLVRDSQQALERLKIVRSAMDRRLKGWRREP